MALADLQAARHTQANLHGQVRGKSLIYKMPLNLGKDFRNSNEALGGERGLNIPLRRRLY